MSNRSILITVIIILLLIGGGFFLYKTQVSTPNTETNNQNGSTNPPPTSPSPTPTPTPTPTPSPSPSTGSVKEFTVTGQNFSFDQKTMTVNKGDTVRITFKAASGFHDFVIDEFNAKTNRLNGGQQETIEFVADKSGSFEYYCSVGSHRAMGMKGTLVVQ